MPLVTIVAQTTSVEETRELGEAVAGLARAGDVVVLAGDLGAGKTAFVQGFAVALGVDEPVTSPTFTLVHEYDGRLPVFHVDVYRLDRLAETADLALGELLEGGGVVLIEWGDAVRGVLPPDYLEIRLVLGEGADDRRLTLRFVGTGWASRWARLTAVVEPWRC
jgi:tRNA threonylcarbamoyladenosine biosynthesis protein TsaE